ncbi:MAG: hypothetical protein IPH43_11385 [Xanthomonadales bacterium]|nr:hypothetical protein [Xanthomonadales bacterium]
MDAQQHLIGDCGINIAQQDPAEYRCQQVQAGPEQYGQQQWPDLGLLDHCKKYSLRMPYGERKKDDRRRRE